MKAAAAKGPPVEAPEAWLERAIAASHDGFVVDGSGGIGYRESEQATRTVGRLVRGASIARPDASALEDFPAGVRARLGKRLQAFARDLMRDLLGDAVELANDSSATVRGLLHRIEQGLGTTLEVGDLIFTDEERARVTEAGIVIGKLAAFAPTSFTSRSLERRALLASLFHRLRVPVPRRGAISFDPRGLSSEILVILGFPRFGPRAIRIDIAEKAFAADDPTLLGIPSRELPKVLAAFVAIYPPPS